MRYNNIVRINCPYLPIQFIRMISSHVSYSQIFTQQKNHQLVGGFLLKLVSKNQLILF